MGILWSDWKQYLLPGASPNSTSPSPISTFPTIAEATMVVPLGVTLSGEKRFLGFVETDTENERVLVPFLRSLVERGLDTSQGLLVVIDGARNCVGR